MSRARSMLPAAVLAVVLGIPAVFVGCDDPPPPPLPPTRSPSARASASVAPSSTVPRIEYTEADFSVSDRNRDPFRGYLDLFVSSARVKPSIQQKIVADNYSLDELKLVAIVSGGTASRAMLVDPTGKGHIVTRGELIGRSESVRSAGQGSSEYDVTWKVERIREGDVIFVREIPGATSPLATRVIALHPEGELTTPRR